MIQLKNVSKFYYSKGVIASGFSKVSLDFKIGEFVAINGESGSGKSTLLNVISGLDTYEEGEMFINGEETSHFNEKDFEDYRRKYIGNIFQNFNLINSYTVYQNIELVLLLNGNKKKEVKKRIIELIKKVDLYKFRNTKVSKLSGGQKQRVAIARALAKETPVIIADEPTGNLDSKSALQIIKILSEISKDKLVIIVTHNYDQVEEHVTRKIKMHDGKVLEDKTFKKIDEVKVSQTATYKNITLLNKIRIGIRNAFNIIPKFLLVFAVYLFITVAVIGQYASFKESEYLATKSGYNNFFQNQTDTRIIIKKKDKTAFNDSDYTNIKNVSNVKTVIQNDLLLDTPINITDSNELWLYCTAMDISLFEGKLSKGRMPENENEIVVEASKYDYYLGSQAELVFEKELVLQNNYNGEIVGTDKYKVVGIKYFENDSLYYNNSIFYTSKKVLSNLSFQINQQYSTMKILFMNTYYESNLYDPRFRISSNSNVPDGSAYITEDNNYLCPKENCINSGIKVEINNLYYTDSKTLLIPKLYNKKNITQLLGITDYDTNNGTVYISQNDYNSLFNRGNFQSSVFADDSKNVDLLSAKLEKMGYKTLAVKDALVNPDALAVIKIAKTVFMIALIVVLFFISYFVLRIILKSRNVYFSTIRMLGATKTVAKNLLIIELLAVSNLAFLITMMFVYINKIEILNIKFMQTIFKYLTTRDYIILYVVLIMMSYLISQKFSKKLFKSSAIKTIKEGE